MTNTLLYNDFSVCLSRLFDPLYSILCAIFSRFVFSILFNREKLENQNFIKNHHITMTNNIREIQNCNGRPNYCISITFIGESYIEFKFYMKWIKIWFWLMQRGNMNTSESPMTLYKKWPPFICFSLDENCIVITYYTTRDFGLQCSWYRRIGNILAMVFRIERIHLAKLPRSSSNLL